MNSHKVRCILVAVAALVAWRSTSARLHAQVNSQNLLTRWYEVGERISYRATGTITDRTETGSYAATASGVVKRDEMGRFFEEFEWSQLVSNGILVQLPPASQAFRQILSLSPDWKSVAPDLSRADPRLIGPALDLRSFYADAAAAMQQASLRFAGDRVVVFGHGEASSWADGSRVILGEDSTDLDLTLDEVSLSDGSATVTVHHVAPGVSNIKTPANWMRTPVADTQNNWVQVVRAGARQFVASVGQETFDVQISLSLTNGKIFSAHLDNRVDVLERECTDEALTMCRDGIRYQIVRHAEI